MCVICQKQKKTSTNRRKMEPLTKCEHIKPEAFLRAIDLRQDERLIQSFAEDFDAVTSDVVYHRSCYRQYTNPRALKYLEDSPMECNEIYTKAINALCANIEPLLYSSKFVRTIFDICSYYNTLLGNTSIENANYRTEKLKQRLRHRFNDVIQFYRPDGFGMPDVLYGPNTPIFEVINFDI